MIVRLCKADFCFGGNHWPPKFLWYISVERQYYAVSLFFLMGGYDVAITLRHSTLFHVVPTFSKIFVCVCLEPDTIACFLYHLKWYKMPNTVFGKTLILVFRNGERMSTTLTTLIVDLKCMPYMIFLSLCVRACVCV